MPDPPSDPERLESRHLIALNCDLDLSREAVCLLGAGAEPWWRDEARATKAEARRLGVRRGELAIARSTLGWAAELAERERERARRCDATIVTRLDASYPAIFRELALPPPVLYVRGSWPRRPCLSIVGARHATAYGREVAELFAAYLAGCGLAVVSGFARGIDTAAHRAAARAAEGVTVAVMGCGLDVDYPRGRRGLRDEICRRGALVSEFPCGAEPLPRNFPIRNRLIAALGHGTLVVEATARSGSLITARLALELGRDVYAVPGRIWDDKSIGPNSLIRDGAFLVQHPREILESLPLAVRDRLPAAGEPAAPPAPALPPEQQGVLDRLPPGEPLGVDELARAAGLPVDRLSCLLLELELAGRVRRHPGPAYSRGSRG
ncbi:MAG: DNA-processing protein DprA [Acidobacteriota bacterium]|nr:DNA-processing protein DprA [Acidobacteriota bacterium]MDH3523047.1 DNA-processing protein DprA [Acidobacteriota bacterium]